VATDTATGETIVFGGYVGSAGSTTVLPPSYQTWTWDGTRWTDRTADQPPPPTASPTPGAH
ncbi:MAG TPA: hypothetical protein VFO60_05955, partial [Candidatus Dormibacteraeota bacterium]|nr:hypothetical protein [Candidatus Dormibacteraeota bacterium]